MKMNTIVSRTILLTAGSVGAAALGGGAVQAQAAAFPREVTSSVVVHYSDRALKTAGGADLLYLRLNRAARAVCGEDSLDPGLTVDFWRAIKSCEQQAVGHAVAVVRSPKLTAVYDAHYGIAPTARTARVSAPPRTDQLTVG